MLHAFYFVIFVKLADISHSSTTMKVTVLCRHSKTVSTDLPNKKTLKKPQQQQQKPQKWERDDKAKLHPQNQKYVFIQTRYSSEFFQIKAEKKNPQKNPSHKTF